MHKSRLAGLIIDCQTEDLAAAAEFWAVALGTPAKRATDGGEGRYVELDVPDGAPYVEVQGVSHESRVHIDIETDDIEAEVARLEKAGARKIGMVRRWVVMEAPTGQRFCVVPVSGSNFDDAANCWEE